jgi:sugar lactone lactonase YvrE
MTLKLSASAFRALPLPLKQVLSFAIDASGRNGRRGFAAAGVCALLLLGGIAPAHAQVTYGGVQTTVGSGLSGPSGVAVDGAGDVFIADYYNNRVVEVPAGGGSQTTVGVGLSNPAGVAVDGAGDVFIADYGNSRVVEVQVGGAQITVASGLSDPTGVAVDGAGDVFITEWEFNGSVVEIQVGGTQTTVASGLENPYGVAVDGAGDVFIADEFDNEVVEVPAGSSSQIIVGSGLNHPSGVAVDRGGNVFIADRNNNRVVEVPAGGGAQITVGSGLSFPTGVAVDGAGDVFVADYGNNTVVEVQHVAVNFGSVNVCPTGQSTPAPCSQTITLPYNLASNTTFGTISVLTQGAASLDFTAAAGGTCSGLVTAATCNVNVTFAPLAPGARLGAVQLSDNHGNLLASTMIYGQGQGPAIAFGPGAQTTVGSGLGFPTAVAVDGAGDVFIADFANNQVVKVPAGGGSQTTVGSGLSAPHGVAVDGAGDVFIANSNQEWRRFRPAVGRKPRWGAGWGVPWSVAVDGAGDVFVADALDIRVVEVPASGGNQITLSTTGLSSPYGSGRGWSGRCLHSGLRQQPGGGASGGWRRADHASGRGIE